MAVQGVNFYLPSIGTAAIVKGIGLLGTSGNTTRMVVVDWIGLSQLLG
jgi:hypothetical protein